ncbi:MAG TPA: flavodoxin domain-containing protein [Actinomycetes bacterium]|nr:flavodoxin domain-containing protein [Actinomycetes bacterium]
MRALVVYESMFGNTRRIAEAIAAGLEMSAQVDLVAVGSAPAVLADDLDLVVVGGPTHAHGMTRPGTRTSAAEQAADTVTPAGTGLRDWLEAIRPRPGLAAATFDTRFDKPGWLTGSAARGAAKRLQRSGCRLVASPESFYVLGTTGPVQDGELDRAYDWGRALGSQHPVTSTR